MANLIDRDALLVVPHVRKVVEYDESGEFITFNAVSVEDIEKASAIDAVSPGTLEQYIWERDCAISQLKEIGKGFGERMDDVARIVRCGECIHRRKPLYPHPTMIWCPMIEHHHHPDWFCAYGKKEEK